ncbi:MAG: oxidoreductase [Mycobacteriaceae bacterium]|nr:oxidoreductase [Mycobacteriaceae bacterium]
MGHERNDPLAALAELPGVAEASEHARAALGKAHRHPINLRGWPATAAEATVRAARASSILDGGAPRFPAEGLTSGPILAGALRVAEALEGGQTALIGVWRRAPLQALARLHALAAADLAETDALGRPRDERDVANRLELLAGLVTGGSAAPAPVLAAVAHGEILTLAPFGSADGVVARAVSRLVTQATGLDPHGLGVPETYWMRRAGDYRAAAHQFATGTAEGLTQWLLLSCRALEEGAREAVSIAENK